MGMHHGRLEPMGVHHGRLEPMGVHHARLEPMGDAVMGTASKVPSAFQQGLWLREQVGTDGRESPTGHWHKAGRNYEP